MIAPPRLAPRSHTRRSSLQGQPPQQSLRGGAALEEPMSRTRSSPSEEEPPGEALKRASSEVKARLEYHLCGDSEEQPPGRALLGSGPWRQLRRAATVGAVPDANSMEDPPGRAHQREGLSAPWRKAGKTRLQGVKPDQESVHPTRGG